jgi:hypothetical protein
VLVACAAAWGAAGVVHANPTPTAAFVVQGEKLLPNDATGDSHVGRGVAMSDDGDVALVGGPHDNSETGSAWVFVREGTAWTQQARLSAAPAGASNFFGRAVALSADGTTALVGDPGNAGGKGAAWVFVRSGSTWSLQAKLTGAGEVGNGQFGRSVSLSGDAGLALVGAFADASGTGAAWTFARSGSTWEQQGAKLTAAVSGRGWFGRGVALSSDGTTALIGASSDSGGVGSAWAYTRNGSAWEQQGGKLTGAGESGRGQFGEAVALSSDGSTGLVAGPDDAEGAGAAWAFTRSGSSWTQQGAKLTGGEEVPPAAFAYSVSLASDGSTALMGGYADDEALGAAWAFRRSGNSWEQDGTKLTAPSETGQGRFGFGVALSADASTALVGALTDNEGVGAAWVFVAPGSGETPPVVEPPPTKTEPETPPGTPISGPPAHLGVLSNTSVAAPVLARTGNIEPVSGTVLVRLPHSTHFVLLTELRQVPFGTLIDATAGEVLVTTARKGKGDQSGQFFSGEFILTQGRNGTVTAILAGGTTSACTGARAKRTSARAARRRKVRKLWANAHGTFSTKGTYAVGAVQGTEWLTEDRCDGTLIRVTRDKVKVTDIVRHRSTVVRAGHSILVKP